ncbi:MAG: tRNA-dihydrouridine synthase, partial [Bauldia sp.]
VASLDAAADHLAAVDGVMLGRAAYHTPAMLADVDRRFYGEAKSAADPRDVVEGMLPYFAAEMARGTPLAYLTRHMLGLFHGLPGARRWRQLLTVGGAEAGAGVAVVEAALAAIPSAAAVAGVDADLLPDVPTLAFA